MAPSVSPEARSRTPSYSSASAAEEERGLRVVALTVQDVNDIVTELLREERRRVTHQSVSGGKKTFLLEPYTLMVYKKGLYLVGRSQGHEGALRPFALDAFKEVEWLRGDKFDYPADYRPEQVTEGALG